MGVDKFSKDMTSDKKSEEWICEKDNLDFLSFLEEDIEETINKKPKESDSEQETKFAYCNWDEAPLLFIPQSIVWIGLDLLAERLRIAPKLAKRHKWKEQAIEKWIHAINCILALVIAYGVLLAILVVLVVIGVDVSKLVED